MSFHQDTHTREATRATRVALGFAPREAWRAAPATFTDHTLTIQGHPVMEDWEDGYMRELATIAAQGGGTVLEVGFGMGISAGYIQRFPIEEHIVIEANRAVYEKLLAFSQTAPCNVTPLLGFWEEITPSLRDGSITGILFDTYPLTEGEIHTNHFPFFKEAFRLLQPNGTLTYYSDEIEEFSPDHEEALREAGFTRLEKRICSVAPPPDCAYWKSPTILAPLIRK